MLLWTVPPSTVVVMWTSVSDYYQHVKPMLVVTFLGVQYLKLKNVEQDA
jgi:hypothetical protein